MSWGAPQATVSNVDPPQVPTHTDATATNTAAATATHDAEPDGVANTVSGIRVAASHVLSGAVHDWLIPQVIGG